MKIFKKGDYYKLPPRTDKSTTTNGPAATIKSNDASCKTNVKVIIN